MVFYMHYVTLDMIKLWISFLCVCTGGVGGEVQLLPGQYIHGEENDRLLKRRIRLSDFDYKTRPPATWAQDARPILHPGLNFEDRHNGLYIILL